MICLHMESKSVNISITGSGASASDRLAYHYLEFHESHSSSFLTIKIELSFVVKHRFLKMEEPTERSLSRGWQLVHIFVFTPLRALKINRFVDQLWSRWNASVDSRPQTGPDDSSFTQCREPLSIQTGYE